MYLSGVDLKIFSKKSWKSGNFSFGFEGGNAEILQSENPPNVRKWGDIFWIRNSLSMVLTMISIHGIFWQRSRKC